MLPIRIIACCVLLTVFGFAQEIPVPVERFSHPSRPDAAAKAAAWSELVANPDVPNETHRSISSTFMRFGQEELLRPYVEKYLAAADTAWEELGTHMASHLLANTFPLPLGSPELVERIDRWLEESPANPAAKRFVREGRADVLRALAAQARDAG